jgi:hypothetical protein
MGVTVLTSEQQAIVEAIREFVGHEALPTASGYDHAGEYPVPRVETMA